MAAPSFISAGAIASDLTGGASTTPTPPTHQADDILVAVAINAADATMSTSTSGWTKIGEVDAGTVRIAWFWARAAGAGTAGPTITAASTDQFAICYVIRGCINTGTPYAFLLGGAGASGISGGDDSPITDSGNTGGADRLVVCFCGHDDDTTISGNPPANWTADSNVTTADGTDAGFRVISRVYASATNSLQATLGTLAAAEQWGTMTLAFIPASTGYTITAAAGSFSYTGGDAGLLLGRVLAAEAGAFPYAGGDAGLAKGFQVAAEPGAFSYAGGDAGLLFNRLIAAELGAFSYAGADAILAIGRFLAAEPGIFSYAGGDAGLSKAYGIAAEMGAFSYAGGDVSLLFNRLIEALAGSFSYAGGDVGLTKSGGSNVIKADTFVETSDTNITAHTPTGPNAGTSWSMMFGSGQVTVVGATDLARDTSSSSGNRAMMSDSLGSSEMDVQGEFTSLGGSNVFPGLMGRLPSGGGAVGIEFTYDFSTGSWSLADGTNSSSLTESWPGGTVTMLLRIRNNDMRGYVNGVEKVQLSSNAFSSNTRAGFLLGNFSGAVNRSTIDNYTSTGIVAGYSIAAAAGSFAYSGGDAGLLFNRLLAAEAGAFNYAGGDVNFAKGYLLAAESGAFAYSGSDAILLFNRILNAAVGAFSYAGGDANLLRGFILAAATGNFSYTGGDAGLLAGRILAAATGIFTYLGGDANLFKTAAGSYTLTADTGAFNYSGGDAGLLFNRVLAAASGSFSYSGGDAALSLARVLTAEPGAFSYAGGDANFLRSHNLAAAAGNFAYTGADVNLLAARILAAATGVFVYSGSDADLLKSSASSYVITAAGGVFSYSGADVFFTVLAPFIRPNEPLGLEISTGESFLELSTGEAFLELSPGGAFLDLETN